MKFRAGQSRCFFEKKHRPAFFGEKKKNTRTMAKSSQKKSAPAKKAPSNRKPKRSFGIYATRTLKALQPKATMASRTKRIINSFVNDIFDRLATQAAAGRHLLVLTGRQDGRLRVRLPDDGYPGWVPPGQLLGSATAAPPPRPLLLDRAAISRRLEQVLAFAEHQGIKGDLEAIRVSPKIADEIGEAIATANKELASYETSKKFEVLPTDFSIETGELTAKLSVKRKVVNSKYGHIFDAFYAEKF